MKCHDCHVMPGEQHVGGCDVERCSVCKGQWISCGCKDHDPSQTKWTGEWPGVVECRELGWYSVLRPDLGPCNPQMGNWWPCTKNFPGASEDLNRWSIFVQANVDQFKGFPVLGTKLEDLTRVERLTLPHAIDRARAIAREFEPKAEVT